MKEITSSFEEEQRLRSEDRDLTTKAEKRANDLQREIEELRVNMEQVRSHPHSLFADQFLSIAGLQIKYKLLECCAFFNISFHLFTYYVLFFNSFISFKLALTAPEVSAKHRG